MPIYAYRCDACGHAKDVLQKISDPLLTTCPSCGQERFSKQVTAAGFQLKGSGWYVTDFRGGNSGKPSSDGGSSAGTAAAAEGGNSDAGASGSGSGSGSDSSGGSDASGSSGSSGGSGSTGSSGTNAAASAGGCGTSCACH